MMNENEKIMLTAEGYLELETELKELKTVTRPQIIKELKEARAQGDLSENSDYDAARDAQAKLEGRIKELEYKLEHCTIAEQLGKDIVCVGSTVTLIYDDGEEDTYKIVGSLEADPFDNKVSNESPIGRAIVGKKVGEEIEVESPNGSYKVVIKSLA